MLKFAYRFKSEINESIAALADDEYFKYWRYGSYAIFGYEINENEWDNIQKVSIDPENDSIIGMICCRVNRDANVISDLSIIKFSKNPNIVFVKDVLRFIDLLFKKNLAKICFSAVVGNPAEKMYDAYLPKIGGTIIGTYHDHVRLIDGNRYDLKLYEIMRDDYLKSERGKNVRLN